MIYYRCLEKGEQYSLANIHVNTFKGFFLSHLGEAFLKIYYKACLNSPKVIGVCAINKEDKMIGFGIGTIISKGFHKEIVFNNFIEFLGQALKILIKNPLDIYRLFKNMNKNSFEDDDGNYAELLSIAVLPLQSGLGIGKELLQEFEHIAFERGCKRICLTTDYYNNSKVLNFYEKLGYKIFYDFITYPNRRMYKMIKAIRD